MTPTIHAASSRVRQFSPRDAAVVLVAALGLVLAGCGDKKADKTATQTAARVNKQEITVHQINFFMQQQRAVPPAQAASASRLVLNRLIDQELAVQEAQSQKLDRDPRVVQQIEAAKREIVARAYMERIGAGVTKPTDEDVRKYYDERPPLFKERRIYNLQELAIEAKPEQVDALKASLQTTQDANAFVEYLKAQGFKFSGKQAMTPAEQLPLDRLDAFARMTEGQSMLHPTPAGVQVVFLAGARSQPVALERARPAIEQFLLNERRQKAIQDELAALRAAAKIEYLGEFAPGAKAAADPSMAVVETRSPLVAPAAAMPEPAAASGSASSSLGSALERAR